MNGKIHPEAKQLQVSLGSDDIMEKEEQEEDLKTAEEKVIKWIETWGNLTVIFFIRPWLPWS